MGSARHIQITDIPADLSALRDITLGKVYKVLSEGVSTYKKPPQRNYLIDDNNGKPIIIYECECSLIN